MQQVSAQLEQRNQDHGGDDDNCEHQQNCKQNAEQFLPGYILPDRQSPQAGKSDGKTRQGCCGFLRNF